jgi:hypothetical protein
MESYMYICMRFVVYSLSLLPIFLRVGSSTRLPHPSFPMDSPSGYDGERRLETFYA